MNRWIVVLALSLVPTSARTDDPCDAWEVEYAVAGRLRVSDTLMGAGDGEHDIGPGRLVLRFGKDDVRVTSYQMANRFTVSARVFGVRTTVVNDSTTRATPNACGVISAGALSDRTLRWLDPWNGVHTDGELRCTGMCGSFGAPPRGRSELHIPSERMRFNPFAFGPDEKTFRMDWLLFNKTSTSAASIVIVGREVRRSCVRARTCVAPGST